ncbi:hypothetical protein RO3G_11825 [Rhizopus delemar RA 99-880]|uniref:Uncharacterized protein n=1 Tax=Rhizopus delemar (strain RA 99-880 / ATCC MYA-4621 / FGSC 9543 / NRRL 43880) TaxID=246409 RepID=I1CF84_RHIO9|nr:hypothetical protein RO3G_11825 [Rhizopus delemar RA 99-880]|eukprot:EIE87114.1 hypothetical protein RO3G_11825 [Rhizopus delemar RA 99-880]
MNNNIQHRESNISVRQRAAEIDKKEKDFIRDSLSSMKSFQQEKAGYLKHLVMMINMTPRRFAAAQLASKNELNIGYEAVKEQEAKMKAKELEEEAKENGIVKYFSRLKEVLNKIDEKLEQDGEIDYLKGLLNDLLIELKDIKK